MDMPYYVFLPCIKHELRQRKRERERESKRKEGRERPRGRKRVNCPTDSVKLRYQFDVIYGQWTCHICFLPLSSMN